MSLDLFLNCRRLGKDEEKLSHTYAHADTHGHTHARTHAHTHTHTHLELLCFMALVPYDSSALGL